MKAETVKVGTRDGAQDPSCECTVCVLTERSPADEQCKMVFHFNTDEKTLIAIHRKPMGKILFLAVNWPRRM